MLLASKYEEIYPPEMRDFVYICDNAYTRAQILDMEQLMLEKLKYCLSYPTPWSFMNRFCKAAGKSSDKQFCHLVSYITELAQVCLTVAWGTTLALPVLRWPAMMRA